MRTAISIPEDLFRKAEKLAKRMKTSRSELYRRAMREYLDRHESDLLTERINEVLAEIAADPTPEDEDLRKFVDAAARQTWERNA